MAITSYAGLKTAIGVWLDRSDLTDYYGDFISFAEGHLNSKLRVRQMEAVTSITPVANVYTLPTDYMQFRKVILDNGTRYPLAYITPDASDMKYPSREFEMSNSVCCARYESKK